MRKLVVVALVLLGIGISAPTIVEKMESAGVSSVDAQTAVNRARSAAIRVAEEGQPDIRKHSLALFTAASQQATGNALAADALCADLLDAGPGFDGDYSDCRAAESATFGASGRICNADDQLRGFFAQGVFRDRDRLRLLEAEASVADAGVVVFEVADPETARQRLAARGFKRCPEVGP